MKRAMLWILVSGAALALACTKEGPPGPTGQQGPPGPAGAAGDPGAPGATGSTGPAGAPVMVEPLAAGSTACPTGGVRFVAADGMVGVACNGAAGPAGPSGAAGMQGPAGPAGPAGASVVTTTLPAGDPNCPTGGTKFDLNGTFTYACNGAAGPTGAAGPAGAQGLQGPAGPQGAAGPAGPKGATGATGATGPTGPTSMPACPTVSFADASGSVSTTGSLLCIYHEVYGKNWTGSSDDCRSFYNGAHLCRYEEMRRGCSTGAIALISGSWLADRSGDDSAVFVNSTNCDNFDGVAAYGTVESGKYCCIEWAKY